MDSDATEPGPGLACDVPAPAPTNKTPIVARGGPAVGLTPDENRDSAELRKDRKLDAVLEVWQAEQESNRKTRTGYAQKLLYGLFVQGLLVDVAFFFIGFGWIEVDEVTARIFIVSVFVELAAMVFFIVKYLFSRSDRALLQLIEKLQWPVTTLSGICRGPGGPLSCAAG